MKNNPPTQTKVNIYTDCQVALQFLNFESYPKYNNIKTIIQAILQILLMIQTNYPNISINITKIKSHANVPGNNIIDRKVRNNTKTIQYN